jgi:hypothetical protein
MQSHGVPGWVKHQIAKFVISICGLSYSDNSVESWFLVLGSWCWLLGAGFQAFEGIVFNHEEHEEKI